MTKKILFWIDSQFVLFGVAKYIQKLHGDYELYLIADCDEKLKIFSDKIHVPQKVTSGNMNRLLNFVLERLSRRVRAKICNKVD